MKKEKCDHPGKKDLTQGLGAERHYYCPNCGTHWYNNRIWTKKEWDEYVNS